jgi:hypothetical protein
LGACRKGRPEYCTLQDLRCPRQAFALATVENIKNVLNRCDLLEDFIRACDLEESEDLCFLKAENLIMQHRQSSKNYGLPFCKVISNTQRKWH